MTGLVLAVVALAATVTVVWPTWPPWARRDPPERVSRRALRHLLESDDHQLDGKQNGRTST
jgi:hypothetical protein